MPAAQNVAASVQYGTLVILHGCLLNCAHNFGLWLAFLMVSGPRPAPNPG
jgi:hypothetical protein